MALPPLANAQQLADALGLEIRTLQRNRKKGLPLPAEGEATAAWAPRAMAWLAEQRARKKPPRKRPDPAERALTRIRNANAKLAELRLKKAQGELHSLKACDEQFERRLGRLTNVFFQLPDKFARKLFQAPSPDHIKLVVEQELRAAFELLHSDAAVEDVETDDDLEDVDEGEGDAA